MQFPPFGSAVRDIRNVRFNSSTTPTKEQVREVTFRQKLVREMNNSRGR